MPLRDVWTKPVEVTDAATDMVADAISDVYVGLFRPLSVGTHTDGGNGVSPHVGGWYRRAFTLQHRRHHILVRLGPRVSCRVRKNDGQRTSGTPGSRFLHWHLRASIDPS